MPTVQPEQRASSTDDLEAEIRARGRELAAAEPRRTPRRAIDDALTRRVSATPRLRSAFYRMVDVAPVCRSNRDLGAHFVSYLRGGDVERRGAAAGYAGLGVVLAAANRVVGRRYIVASSPAKALPYIEGLWRRDMGATLDLLGEAVVRAEEADSYAARCVDALEILGRAAAARPAPGPDEMPAANLSVKPSALTAEIRPWAPWSATGDAAMRLRAVLRKGKEVGAHVHVDMESLDSRETTLEMLGTVLAEDELRAGPSIGVVLQAYLRDSAEVADAMLGYADRRDGPVAIRLVKGAYWDQETIQATEHGWMTPVFETRRETDRNFESLTRKLLDARPRIRLAIGSHNLRSISHALAYADASDLGRTGLEFQVLRGLGDELGRAIAACGGRARVYTPVGDLIAGMAYLVRRLLENTSNDSFLVARARTSDLEILLARP
jgi:RHH-type proline utilization regulon transcriptional repressor/proline dehydrogenase/delta 1-pyrroline-5-carboxylate dehydrogenase